MDEQDKRDFEVMFLQHVDEVVAGAFAAHQKDTEAYGGMWRVKDGERE